MGVALPTVMPHIPSMRNAAERLIRLALAEDIRHGDATTRALVDPQLQGEAVLVMRHDYVLAGAVVANDVFQAVDEHLDVDFLAEDGESPAPHEPFMRIAGSVASMLTAERTALNFIQRMTGIATLARKFVREVEGTGCFVLDTRKTLPGYRALDKYAVKCGGASNHRMGLYDRVMIKDNHVQHWTGHREANLPEAVTMARKRYPKLKIEAEADTVDQVRLLVKARPDWILLDNMDLDQLRECVGICKGVCQTEASGGVTLETVRAIAETGVDAVSVGALTHSVQAADISLDLL